jgi:myosin heavy subunit
MMYQTALEVCAVPSPKGAPEAPPPRVASHGHGYHNSTVCRPCRADARSRDVVASSVEDLATLAHLHEPSLLHVLSLRFSKDLIYTCSGSILLAVNPFKTLPLYTEVGLCSGSSRNVFKLSMSAPPGGLA